MRYTLSLAININIGIAAATQVSFPIVLGELLPMKYRFYGNALIFLFCIPGSGFGPAVANVFILNTSAGWRGVYYLVSLTSKIALMLETDVTC